MMMLGVIGVIAIASLLSFSAELRHAVQIIVSSVLVLFLPGFSLSYLIDPTARVSTLDRVILALITSLPLEGLVVLGAVRLGAPLNLTTTLVSALVLTGGLTSLHLLLRHGEQPAPPKSESVVTR